MNHLNPPITLLPDAARKREFHRSKANNVSFRSVKLPFSGDTVVKSYDHLLVGMYFTKFRKNLELIFWVSFWGALTCVTCDGF